MTYLAWHTPPTLNTLAVTIETSPTPLHLIICLSEQNIPIFTLSSHPSSTESRLKTQLDSALKCLQFNSINFFEHLLPNVHIWIVPKNTTSHLSQHFPQPIQWQNETIPQIQATEPKPWFKPPQYHIAKSILIIGAGIAGATTARLFAEQGIQVTVLESGDIAQKGSGNQQGLLYAKISPHPTEQTELLLSGYGYTHRLLERLFPKQQNWGGNGVLHLNYNESETKRNHTLAKQQHHNHLYHSVSQAEIEKIAGIPFDSDGLYWPQGVWINPPSIIKELLNHPLIQVHTHTPLEKAQHTGTHWLAHSQQRSFQGSHIIYCTGAYSPNCSEPNLNTLPFRQIRGQTGIAQASSFSNQLRCAVSAESYISPSWQDQHCYGASFILNSNDEQWCLNEEITNRNGLTQLNNKLAHSLFSNGLNPITQAHGHAALRCDSPDHLPMVGALGNIDAMQNQYAKLALDKNYRINEECSYLPQAYLNTAHGTRGLATAPLCSASLVAEILNLPNPLTQHLRSALHPNRTIIRAIIRGKPLSLPL